MTNIIAVMRTKRKPRRRQQLSFARGKQIIHDDDESERLKREWLASHEPTKLPPGWSRMGFAPA